MAALKASREALEQSCTEVGSSAPCTPGRVWKWKRPGGEACGELRKPVVEKMRRDRINSSIEQLKLLLEKEFQRHQPNSKLEKADILEMTVSYLKQQSQLQLKTVASFHKSSQFDFREGYSRCLQEAFHFLSLHKVRTETQSKLLSHFQKSQAAAPEVAFSPGKPSALKQASPKDAGTLWRPW
nr:transcription factor HES-5-like isoform X2 [Anser cygnoides]